MSIQNRQSEFLRWAMLAGLGAIVLFVAYGVWRIPDVGYLGPLAVGIIVMLYGLMGWFGPDFTQRRDPYVLQISLVAGLVAGAIFAVEILAEYVLLPQDNNPYGLVEYGLVLLIFLASSVWVAWRRNSFRKGLVTAIWVAMIAELIWYFVLILTFHIFLGSARQSQVFQADGDYLDFARSGVSNFRTFIFQDYLGAGFYHSLILPIAAAIMGTVGGLIGRLMSKVWHERG